MSDARWFEIEADIRSAVRHFRQSVALHGEGGFDAPNLAGYKVQMALMHALQSGHTALESGLVAFWICWARKSRVVTTGTPI